ncbi:MAG: iron ABC transporter permease [Clostridium argentinense]|nr:iron ABC transporter permease [Clostridium argentinense]
MYMEKLKSNGRWKTSIIIVFAIIAVSGFFVSNSLGSMKIPIKEIFQVILNNTEDARRQVIWNVRIPRTIVAALVGINLAVSGAILQGVMRNPLADPQIIGISSGAGLAGIIILILFPQHIQFVPIVAFIGAMAAYISIYIIAWKDGIKPNRIILSGVAVSAFLGAGITGLMVFYADRVHGALMFMAGGLSARSWPQVKMILPYTVLGLILAFLMREKLNILILGDDVARGLGLNVESTRLIATVIAALLAASAVSVVGLLGFVGLIVPHIVRLIVGTDYKYLIPGSVFLGSEVLMYSDTIARTIFSPIEIPVGVIMAAIGAPFFLYLLRRE